MIAINCSGLATLSRHPFSEDHLHQVLFQGDSRDESIWPLYLEGFSQRKVLYSSININVSWSISYTIILDFDS